MGQEMLTKIAIVDDDTILSHLLKLWLEPYGYECRCFESGELFLESQYLTNKLALAIIDWSLPGMSGMELIKLIESTSERPAIIVITAKNSIDDIAHALHIGADDCLCKPLDKTIMLARIRAVMRRYSKQQKLSFSQPAISFIPSSLELIDTQGNRCRLSAAQFRALEFLMTHPGQIISRALLCEAVWGTATKNQTNRALDLLISRLRTKLMSIPNNPVSIVSHYALGYKCYCM